MINCVVLFVIDVYKTFRNIKGSPVLKDRLVQILVLNLLKERKTHEK